MSKFTIAERRLIQDIVSTLTIKRIPDAEIIKQVYNQTNKTVTRQTLSNLRQSLKKESARWYQELKQGEYQYLHEFKERINEIMDLQKKTHEIIDNNENNPAIQLNAISELHKLNITPSNYLV